MLDSLNPIVSGTENTVKKGFNCKGLLKFNYIYIPQNSSVSVSLVNKLKTGSQLRIKALACRQRLEKRKKESKLAVRLV